ncbi:hypothetical protein L227DRAFT_561427 [Lentinus tigrinus ALCF2SS1-6]|uniref:Uncharacterized protein n=1 Tax=Lentinus tigrinus ALCF2SS1-6 TaxID=1328759 RepID=A0A5C2SLH9_9APHY|nr:hypothetical protein L227DRAFT_561427 [Lentinus tigrinus ALCF2SS1-6]
MNNIANNRTLQVNVLLVHVQVPTMPFNPKFFASSHVGGLRDKPKQWCQSGHAGSTFGAILATVRLLQFFAHIVPTGDPQEDELWNQFIGHNLTAAALAAKESDNFDGQQGHDAAILQGTAEVPQESLEHCAHTVIPVCTANLFMSSHLD